MDWGGSQRPPLPSHPTPATSSSQSKLAFTALEPTLSTPHSPQLLAILSSNPLSHPPGKYVFTGGLSSHFTGEEPRLREAGAPLGGLRVMRAPSATLHPPSALWHARPWPCCLSLSHPTARPPGSPVVFAFRVYWFHRFPSPTKAPRLDRHTAPSQAPCSHLPGSLSSTRALEGPHGPPHPDPPEAPCSEGPAVACVTLYRLPHPPTPLSLTSAPITRLTPLQPPGLLTSP